MKLPLKMVTTYSGKGLDCTRLGQALIIAFIKVAKGIAKNTPAKPHMPPKKRTAKIIATGWRFTASEKINSQYLDYQLHQ